MFWKLNLSNRIYSVCTNKSTFEQLKQKTKTYKRELNEKLYRNNVISDMLNENRTKLLDKILSLKYTNSLSSKYHNDNELQSQNNLHNESSSLLSKQKEKYLDNKTNLENISNETSKINLNNIDFIDEKKDELISKLQYCKNVDEILAITISERGIIKQRHRVAAIKVLSNFIQMKPYTFSQSYDDPRTKLLLQDIVYNRRLISLSQILSVLTSLKNTWFIQQSVLIPLIESAVAKVYKETMFIETNNIDSINNNLINMTKLIDISYWVEQYTSSTIRSIAKSRLSGDRFGRGVSKYEPSLPQQIDYIGKNIVQSENFKHPWDSSYIFTFWLTCFTKLNKENQSKFLLENINLISSVMQVPEYKARSKILSILNVDILSGKYLGLNNYSLVPSITHYGSQFLGDYGISKILVAISHPSDNKQLNNLNKVVVQQFLHSLCNISDKLSLITLKSLIESLVVFNYRNITPLYKGFKGLENLSERFPREFLSIVINSLLLGISFKPIIREKTINILRYELLLRHIQYRGDNNIASTIMKKNIDSSKVIKNQYQESLSNQNNGQQSILNINTILTTAQNNTNNEKGTITKQDDASISKNVDVTKENIKGDILSIKNLNKKPLPIGDSMNLDDTRIGLLYQTQTQNKEILNDSFLEKILISFLTCIDFWTEAKNEIILLGKAVTPALQSSFGSPTDLMGFINMSQITTISHGWGASRIENAWRLFFKIHSLEISLNEIKQISSDSELIGYNVLHNVLLPNSPYLAPLILGKSNLKKKIFSVLQYYNYIDEKHNSEDSYYLEGIDKSSIQLKGKNKNYIEIKNIDITVISELNDIILQHGTIVTIIANANTFGNPTSVQAHGAVSSERLRIAFFQSLGYKVRSINRLLWNEIPFGYSRQEFINNLINEVQ